MFIDYGGLIYKNVMEVFVVIIYEVILDCDYMNLIDVDMKEWIVLDNVVYKFVVSLMEVYVFYF